jgi:hypothetical protein
MPGTETKVTPESEAPIIPMATTGQGDLRSPRKKALLFWSDPLDKTDISKSNPK